MIKIYREKNLLRTASGAGAADSEIFDRMVLEDFECAHSNATMILAKEEDLRRILDKKLAMGVNS
jgi:hypothetical protein